MFLIRVSKGGLLGFILVVCSPLYAGGYWALSKVLPAQLDSKSCQSSALAMALTLADLPGKYGANNEAEFKQLETAIRNNLVRQMNAINQRVDDYNAKIEKYNLNYGRRMGSFHREPLEYKKRIKSTTRTMWKKTVEELTNDRYTLYQITFDNIDGFYRHLLTNTSPLKPDTNQDTVLLSTPHKLFLSSVKSINMYSFSSGHVIGIVSIGNIYLLKNGGRIHQTVPLLMTNSYTIEGGLCPVIGKPKVKPIGKISWVDTYEMKQFSDGNYYLNWIDLKEYQSKIDSQKYSVYGL